MNRKWISVLVSLAIALSVWGMLPAQAAPSACAAGADYRSAASGNWNNAGTWECFNGATWEAAAASPTNAEGAITIQNSHTVTVSANVTADQITVNAGGQIVVNSSVTWTIADGSGIDLTINGTVLNNSTLARGGSATFTIGAGGSYIHNTGTTANGIAWTLLNVNSNFEYRQVAALSVAPIYGNLIINNGTNATHPGGILDVAGNLVIQPGVNFRIVNTAGASATINLTGNLILNGTGNFTGNVGGTGTATLNIGGSISSGSFSAGAGTGGFLLNFTGGTTTATFAPTGGFTSNGNVTIANTPSGKTVTLGSNIAMNGGNTLTVTGTLNTGLNAVIGAGAFTLNSGANLGIGSPDGIDSGTTLGNIRVSGTRTFNAAANYTFNGTTQQVAGTGFPTTVNNLTVAAGAQVILPTGIAAAALTNNGTITQTQTVNGNTNVTFIGIGGYGGVVLNANNLDLGSTIVAIKGNQACNVGDQLIHRCFNIIPTNTTGRSAVVTFFFTEGERNNNSCPALEVYHWNGTAWDAAPLARDVTYGPTNDGRDCDGSPRSIRVTGVTTFSPFGLKSGAIPTAITLREIKASPSSSPIVWLTLVASIALLSGVLIILRRRSRSA